MWSLLLALLKVGRDAKERLRLRGTSIAVRTKAYSGRDGHLPVAATRRRRVAPVGRGALSLTATRSARLRTATTRQMGEEEKRLALNEAMFREINERLESQLPVDRDNRLSVLCECADADCVERIELTPEEYASARAQSRQFILAPGHEIIEIEDVVSRNDRYEIVRKKGYAGEIAKRTDST